VVGGQRAPRCGMCPSPWALSPARCGKAPDLSGRSVETRVVRRAAVVHSPLVPPMPAAAVLHCAIWDRGEEAQQSNRRSGIWAGNSVRVRWQGGQVQERDASRVFPPPDTEDAGSHSSIYQAGV
jgi:hypothetical protein